MYGLLADVVLMLHALFIAFVVFGLLAIVAGWLRGSQWIRNPAFRYTHLLAILFVVAEAWLGIICPLTTLENWLPRQAGEPRYATSFRDPLINVRRFVTAIRRRIALLHP